MAEHELKKKSPIGALIKATLIDTAIAMPFVYVLHATIRDKMLNKQPLQLAFKALDNAASFMFQLPLMMGFGVIFSGSRAYKNAKAHNDVVDVLHANELHPVTNALTPVEQSTDFAATEAKRREASTNSPYIG